MKQKLLEVTNVYKTYAADGKPFFALDGVSLDLFKGEIVTLLGENGAGKTTLSSIIASLRPPTSGSITYNGESIYNQLIAYRRIIGLCPQKPNFERRLTVRENLYFPGRYFGLVSAQIDERVNRLLREFELEKYANQSPDILSGGYKQRLLIARALVHEPQLVILDEPTVALDPQVRRNLWNTIKALKDRGITILLTTHYLDEAEVLSDRVCMMHRGRIIVTSTPEELKKAHAKTSLEEVFIHLIAEYKEQV
jgi:ABC-2 type transport system ATP-binding protein